MPQSRRWKILLVQGANMSHLGRRDPEFYGTTTAAELDTMVHNYAAERNIDLEIVYTNIEGEAIDRIYRATEEGFDGLLMNPAGFQYAGYALRDCLLAVRPALPYVEIHITKHSITGGLLTVTAAAAQGYLCGFGTGSYLLGIDALVRILVQAKSI